MLWEVNFPNCFKPVTEQYLFRISKSNSLHHLCYVYADQGSFIMRDVCANEIVKL